jgi:ABC-type multidrug transport system ATPase subunit
MRHSIPTVRLQSTRWSPSVSGSPPAAYFPGCDTPNGDSIRLGATMSLLELELVSKGYGHGARPLLDGVSLRLDPGELVVIWGARQAGRSTLLRVAAGIEPPDAGTVRFDGRNLGEGRAGVRSRRRWGERWFEKASRSRWRRSRSGPPLLGSAIGYFRPDFLTDRGSTVFDQLISGQRARRVPNPTADARAWRALERVDCVRCANASVRSLKIDEIARIGIARLLTSEPRLLVLDEPVLGVDPVLRDGILRLLRSLAHDDGIAVLVTTDEGPGLLGADRVLFLEHGELDGEVFPKAADVTDIATHRQARSG